MVTCFSFIALSVSAAQRSGLTLCIDVSALLYVWPPRSGHRGAPCRLPERSAGPRQAPVLHVVSGVCVSTPASQFTFPAPPFGGVWRPYICFLPLCICFCFANESLNFLGFDTCSILPTKHCNSEFQDTECLSLFRLLTAIQRTVWLINNRDLFLIILRTGKSKVLVTGG